jgi:hypothetical protein
MAEPLSQRCCCGHARRSHVPCWTWRLTARHVLQRHPEPPNGCRFCACPGYFAPLAAADSPDGTGEASRYPVALGTG